MTDYFFEEPNKTEESSDNDSPISKYGDSSYYSEFSDDDVAPVLRCDVEAAISKSPLKNRYPVCNGCLRHKKPRYKIYYLDCTGDSEYDDPYVDSIYLCYSCSHLIKIYHLASCVADKLDARKHDPYPGMRPYSGLTFVVKGLFGDACYREMANSIRYMRKQREKILERLEHRDFDSRLQFMLDIC